MSVRVAAVWVPDWPVLAAMSAEEVPLHRPAVVHDARGVTAVSAAARRQGVRRGMRRRQAQQCCPDLVLLHVDAGRDTRMFEPVAVAAESVVAGVEVARPGLLLLPAAGAGRYHGSERVLAERLVDAVAEQTGYEAQVGVADGGGAAVLAARSSRLVPPGATPAFLAPLGVGELLHVVTGEAVEEVPALVDLLVRLGLRTLGDLAGLDRADVQTRFGVLGGWAHRVAAGQDEQTAVVRRPEADLAVAEELDPPVDRVEATAFVARRLAEALHVQLVARGVGCGRLRIAARTEDGHELVRTWRTDTALGGLSVPRMTDRVRWQLEGWLTAQGVRRPAPGTFEDPAPAPLVALSLSAEQVVPVGVEQGGLWGDARGADLRAQRAVHRVQGLLGADAVLGAALQGGREVRDQIRLTAWGEAVAPSRTLDAPWPGRLPPPAPATVLVESEVVQLCGVDGRRVQVDARLQVSAEPEVVWWSTTDASPRESKVTGWAGPWPVVQRWWGPEPRRQVYLQASLQDGRAVLLALTDGVWTVEALYD